MDRIEKIETEIKQVELDNKLYEIKIQNEKLRQKYERTRDAPCPCCYPDYCPTKCSRCCSSLHSSLINCLGCIVECLPMCCRC